MLRDYSGDYAVDGKAMLAPDAEAEISFTDLDSSDSGRTEDGVMHRIVVREKVGTWGFTYAVLDAEDYAYILGLFSGKATFSFRHPGGVCTAYCSKNSIVLCRQGLYKNLKFNVIQC